MITSVCRRALKIRVSAVRFCPRPPVFKGNRYRLPFPFSAPPRTTRDARPICVRCAVYNAVSVSGQFPLFRFLPVLCSQKTWQNRTDAGTRRTHCRSWTCTGVAKVGSRGRLDMQCSNRTLGRLTPMGMVWPRDKMRDPHELFSC